MEIDREQNNPLVSIIVPIYNVSGYLKKCLDSVYVQSYRPLEVILVDDCGTDNSVDIAEEYVKEHNCNDISFRILHHAHNRGLSAARNTGTESATGKYVFYLDSDDSILPDSIRLLVSSAEYYNTDLTVGNYQNVGENIEYGGKCNLSDGTVVEGRKENIECFCQRNYYVMAWNKLVRLDFLREHNITFIEGILHEDSPWSLEVAYNVGKLSVVNKITYNYLVRPGSISTNVKIQKKIESWTIILNTFIKLIEHHPEYKDNKIVYEYYANEILNYFKYVVEEMPRKAAIRQFAILSNFKYDSRWFNMSEKLPITHYMLNLMFYLPSLFNYYLVKLLLNYK